MTAPETTSAWLWLAVVVSGFYHGVNPGMGWPLAVAAGLMDKSPRALLAALWPLSIGHLTAMLVMLSPFAMLLALAQWRYQVQAGASILVIAFGAVRLLHPRHPRLLATIRPTQLALWSFVVALAHGAALMLVPVYLGLCQASGSDQLREPAAMLGNANLGMAAMVSLAHSIAMISAGGCAAWLVYRYLGLRFVSQSWFNLDRVWAGSLVLVGAIGLAGWH
ncbi:MAG: hypothetical protein JOZ74_08010 [Bradyrhizobium sp.]|nr:hypothetical protein [Bradyrhizobium sp.]